MSGEPLRLRATPGRRPRAPRRRGAALLWLALLAGACAQAPGSPPDPAGRPLFLWQVEPAAGGGRLYLFGSVHLLRPGDFPEAPLLDAAYAASDTLVLEVDPEELDPGSVQELMSSRGALPEGRSLQDELSPQTWALLEEALDRHGLPETAVDRYEPWAVALMLTVLRPRDGRRVIGLETAEFQIALFDGLSAEVQELMLRETLYGALDSVSVLEEMVRLWKAGDADGLDRLLLRAMQEHPELRPFYEATFFQRNLSMAARLEELLAEGGTLFATVGAGHVVGERGIVALLRERGYAVRQLRDR
jgi:uncharacterized protein YbaP (TraB family)